MTLSAAQRDAEEDLGRRVHPVDHSLDAILLLIDAALAIGQRVAMKARRHLLIAGRLWKKIAGQLLDDELIVGQVAIERADDPVAPAPGERAAGVLFIAVAVGVAGEVEPVAAPALAVGRRGQQ